MLETIIESFLFEFDQFLEFLPRLLLALIISFLIYLMGRLAAKGILKILNRRSITTAYHSFFKRLTIGVFVFIAFISFLNIIGYTGLAASLLAGGGLTAVILGFAFKDIGENFLAGFFLAFSRPFNDNDLIESDGITGVVKSISLRHTHIRTMDGCDVFIPNVQIFTKPLLNYTLDGLRRGNFVIGIDFGDDAKAATELLLKVVNQTAGVLKSPPPVSQIKGFTPNYVEIQVFFWINARNQQKNLPNVRSATMDACRKALLENGFTVSSNVTTSIDLSPVDVAIDSKKQI